MTYGRVPLLRKVISNRLLKNNEAAAALPAAIFQQPAIIAGRAGQA